MTLDELARESVRDLREAGRQARFTARPPGGAEPGRRAHRRPAWVYAAAGFGVAVVAASVTWTVLGGGEPDRTAAAGTGLSPVDRWGITDADLPDTLEEIAAVFDSMPAEVAGHARVGEPNGEHLVDYGAAGDEGSSLTIQLPEHRLDVSGVPMSIPEALARMAGAPELYIVAGTLEGDPVWLHGSTASEDGTEWFLVWGEATGEYVFTFNAWTLDDLDAIVAAFLETTGAVAADPPPAVPEGAGPETTTLPQQGTEEGDA